MEVAMKRFFTRGIPAISAVALALAGAASLAARTVTIPILVHNQARPAITIGDRFDDFDAGGFARAEAGVVSAMHVDHDGFLRGASDRAGIQALADSAFDGDLLVLEVPDRQTVDAWLRTDLPHGSRYHSAVPLIDETMIAAAGAELSLYNLDRGVAALRVLNFGTTAASCSASDGESATWFDAEPGRQAEFAAFSTRTAQDALRVSCDQPFYAFATVFDPGDGRLAVVGPAPHAPVTARAEAGLPPLTLVWEKLGLVHAPTKECGPGKKGIVKMPVDEETSVSNLVAVLDILVGKFTKASGTKVFGPFWLHRDDPRQPFRSNSIMNVNHTNTNSTRWNSNLDRPKGGGIAKAAKSFKLPANETVQLQVIHNAADKKAAVNLYDKDGKQLLAVPGEAFGFERQLLLKAKQGTKLEIGHNCHQHHPEMPWNDTWKFSNFRIEFFLKEAKN
jgi:hypothetical protein